MSGDSWGSSIGVSSDSWGSVDSSDSWGSVDGSNSGGSLDMVRVSHDWSSLGPLDDGLSLDSDWDGDIVWGINMDWGGNLDNLVGGEGGVIRSIVWLVDKDGFLDVVDLSLGLDNGSVDGLGSLEDSWDLDGEVRSGGLQDSGGVSGDIVGLTKVDLLGDHGGGLVDSGDTLGLSNSGVWSWSWGSNMVDRVLDNGSGSVVLRSIGRDSSCGGSSIGGSHSWSSHGSHCWSSNSVVARSSVSTSQDKSKCHLKHKEYVSTEHGPQSQ